MRLIRVGTSGWVYKEWAGAFYPKGWPHRDEFAYYARHFPTVEINATFYRLPTPSMVRGWHDRAPEDFVYAVKGSRYLTHLRRLRDTGAGLLKYFRRLKPLADRCGPVLWQLPPNFAATEENSKRLERFLAKLPKSHRHAVEFRHPSWFVEPAFDLLRRYRVAKVWISSLRMPQDYTLTTDFAYLRFHGLKNGAYHDYTADELRPWARELARVARQGCPAYVYFNNDLKTRAPLNAAALIKMLGRYAIRATAQPGRSSNPRIAPIASPVVKSETWRDSWSIGGRGRTGRRRTSEPKSPRRRQPRSVTAPPERWPVPRFAAATSARSASAAAQSTR
jgi:uncharacterized protein YecE (DUF72 family)